MTKGHLQVTAIANPAPRVKVADALGNRWMIQCEKGGGGVSFIAKGARKTSWNWTSAKSGAKLFVTRGEASRYAADFVAPYMDRRNGPLELVAVPYGPTRAEVSGNKNPAVTGNKNPTPRASAYIVRGMRRSSKVTVSPMYFTGYGFDTDKTKAVRFMTAKIAQHALEKVEETFPKVAAILNMDVIQA